MNNLLILLALVAVTLFSPALAISGLVIFYNFVRWEKKQFSKTVQRKASEVCYA